MHRSLITIMSLLVISQLTWGKVLLMGKSTSLSFDDVEATSTPIVESSRESGELYAAEPLDACSDLTNTAENGSQLRPSYVLIIRGGCSFEVKVRMAQSAGCKAAIVYNNEYDDELLVQMAGNSAGVNIHGMLVTRVSREVLREYAGRTEMELWLIPGFRASSWSMMAITFISLFIVSVVLATFFFVRKQQRVPSLSNSGRGFSSIMVQRIPTEVFSGVLEVGSTSVSCAICIDDYCLGDKLKILPCQHKFHATCIDSWFGHWRFFCPVCKHDVRAAKGKQPASEQTPQLQLQSLPISITQEPLACSSAQVVKNAFSQRFTHRTSQVSASPS